MFLKQLIFLLVPIIKQKIKFYKYNKQSLLKLILQLFDLVVGGKLDALDLFRLPTAP